VAGWTTSWNVKSSTSHTSGPRSPDANDALISRTASSFGIVAYASANAGLPTPVVAPIFQFVNRTR